jgi:hypothetical protein
MHGERTPHVTAMCTVTSHCSSTAAICAIPLPITSLFQWAKYIGMLADPAKCRTSVARSIPVQAVADEPRVNCLPPSHSIRSDLGLSNVRAVGPYIATTALSFSRSINPFSSHPIFLPSQFLHPPQTPRMPIHLRLHIPQLQLLQVEIEFFAVLCFEPSVSKCFPSGRPAIDSIGSHIHPSDFRPSEGRKVVRKRSYSLNPIFNFAGWSACCLESILIWMAMVERALGGSRARKLRAILPVRGLKGEKLVVTEVMYLVIILAVEEGEFGLSWVWLVMVIGVEEEGCGLRYPNSTT